jgi:hypothetical protein
MGIIINQNNFPIIMNVLCYHIIIIPKKIKAIIYFWQSTIYLHYWIKTIFLIFFMHM